MTAPLPDTEEPEVSSCKTWLDRPLSSLGCFAGWLASSALFVGLIYILGGPTEEDANQSVYSTWAVEHGHLACAFAPATAASAHFPSPAVPGSFIAPLYPLLSGFVAALFRIGHAVAFPSTAQLGPHCSKAYNAMFLWSVHANAILPTIRIGYVSWLMMLVGVVVLLRSSGRGRCGWEPATLLLLACVAPIFEAIVFYFHPQDILAIGLILAGLACVRREKWLWAGVMLGLAITSQQFALLAFVPLLVVAPRSERLRFAGGSVLAFLVVVTPFLLLSSGRATRAVIVGSGFTPSVGGTLVWELHLHGAAQFTLTRLVPIVCALVFALWVLRKLGEAVLEPVLLVSLMATALCFRLVFEENLFGYYFMAVSVMIVMGDMLRGRLRGYTVAWLALATISFNPIPWGFDSNGQSWGLTARLWLPIVAAGIALLVIAFDAARRRFRWYVIAWFVYVMLTLVKMPWTHTYLRHWMPTWFWQLTLVPTALYLAVSPLIQRIRQQPIATAPFHDELIDV